MTTEIHTLADRLVGYSSCEDGNHLVYYAFTKQTLTAMEYIVMLLAVEAARRLWEEGTS